MFGLKIARRVLGIKIRDRMCFSKRYHYFVYYLTLFVAYLTIICDITVEANKMNENGILEVL